MPRHEFRTIEEFVLLLEKKQQHFKEQMEQFDGDELLYKMAQMSWASYGCVLEIVRNSNLGIVYPPSIPALSSFEWIESPYIEGTVFCPCCNALKMEGHDPLCALKLAITI